MRILLHVTVLAASLAPLSSGAIPVAYELSSYSHGGYSANWVHSADGCQHGNLFMCNGSSSDSFLIAIKEGSLLGDYADGALTGVTGQLTLTSNPLMSSIAITGGSLGPTSGYLDYSIDSAASGRFFFEPLGLGAGLPNAYSLDRLLLWGQNADAYVSALGWNPGPLNYGNFLPLGIDLHAKLVSVPEPSTLGLLGLGLAALASMRRRRPQLTQAAR